jgi:HAD superfamily hydrolase (TIGR01509 family)
LRYEAALIDIDGTLVDSNDAHAHAWVQALAEHGRHVAFTRVRPLIGMGGDKLLDALARIDAESEQGQAIAQRRRDIFKRDYLPRLRPTRGAARLLEWLRDDNIRPIVATSARADEVQDLLAVAGATKLVDGASSSDDVEESKPDPDIVHAALAKAGCPAEAAIMIGDTPYDIEAAERAGVRAIALRCGGWWNDRALQGALAIYDDPDDLVERYFLSPFKRPVPVRLA